MPIAMTGEALVPAPRPLVWHMLNDPDVLKACIPDCETLEMMSETSFAATVNVKVGLVKATFRGRINLEDLDPLNGYRLSGEGDGGISGFAKCGARVHLNDGDGGTLMRYEVEALIGGKLAQIGERLIDGVGKNMADEFFARFVKIAKRMRAEDAEALGWDLSNSIG